jgi:RND superfamily putative drug exporter
VGADIVRKYFPPGELGPTTLLLANDDVDFLSKEGRAAIGALSETLRALPNVAEVRSVTEPLGRVPNTRKERAALTLLRRQTDPRYVGGKGHITRLELVFQSDPFALASHESVERVRDVAAEEAKSGLLAGSRIGQAGVTVQILDLKRIITADQRRMYVLVTGGVYLILLVLIRKPLVCFYLILTVILGYLASMGAAELLFRWLHTGSTPWVGLDWKVGFFLFVILVAIGEDYNIFLMSRVIEEEAKHGPIEGCHRAITSTGGIISSCGLIMAGTFCSMLTGRLTTLKEMGFALGLGVVLDTFIVRPVLVPAFLVLWHRSHPKEKLESPIHAPEAVAEGTPTA